MTKKEKRRKHQFLKIYCAAEHAALLTARAQMIAHGPKSPIRGHLEQAYKQAKQDLVKKLEECRETDIYKKIH